MTHGFIWLDDIVMSVSSVLTGILHILIQLFLRIRFIYSKQNHPQVVQSLEFEGRFYETLKIKGILVSLQSSNIFLF